MDDEQLIELFFARSEEAITKTDQKYGPYCYSIANRILSNPSDAEETVNDTYYSAWTLIPPQRSARFSIFLGKLTRNLSIDRWRFQTAEKRGKGETHVLLDELAECVAGGESPETTLLREERIAFLNDFLRGLPREERTIFLLRYFYAFPQKEIAKRMCVPANRVKYVLQKTRKGLRETMMKEGVQ